MSTYAAQIAVQVAGLNKLNDLENRLIKVSKLISQVTRPVGIKLQTAGLDRQLAAIERRMRSLNRSVTLTINERYVSTYDNRGNRGNRGGSGSAPRGGGGGGMAMAIGGAAAMAGVTSRSQRALSTAITTALSKAVADAAAALPAAARATTPRMLGSRTTDYAGGRRGGAAVNPASQVPSLSRPIAPRGAVTIQATTVAVQGRGVTAASNRRFAGDYLTSYQRNQTLRHPYIPGPRLSPRYIEGRPEGTSGLQFWATPHKKNSPLGVPQFGLNASNIGGGATSFANFSKAFEDFLLTAKKGTYSFVGMTERLDYLYQNILERKGIPYRMNRMTGQMSVDVPLRNPIMSPSSDAGAFRMNGAIPPRSLGERYRAGSLGLFGGGGGRPPSGPKQGPALPPPPDFKRAEDGADGLAGSLGKLALAYFGVETAIRAVTGTLQKGIAFDTASAKLRNLSASFGESSEVMQLTERSASRFGQGIVETSDQMAQLYGRLRPLGLSLTEIEAVFNGFNTAARLSGSTAAESAGALLQLTQALGSGALRGQELNSVLEQAPLVAQAIARELNAPIGQLKKLAEDGKITSDVVVRALAKISTEGGAKLAASMNTSAQKVKDLQNAFERLQIAISKLALPAFLKTVEALTGLFEKQATFVTNVGDAWGYVAEKLAPVVALYQQLADNPIVRGVQGLVLSGSPLGPAAAGLGFVNQGAANLAAMGRRDRQRNFVGPAAPQWYGPAPRNVPTTSLQDRLGTGAASAASSGKAVEEAVRRGVIGGLTGGGQADASRGRSSGPHLHAQGSGDLRRLVDAALDFGGGRTASSFGISRGAAGHGYNAIDYLTPQGSPFTLRPGWSATDMGIRGALGRGMRVSGPGGVFELGHLQGVTMGDLNGKGAASDLLSAQQEALNAAIEFQQKQAEQLATSQQLLALAQQDLAISQAKNPIEQAVLEGKKAELEIRQKYAELLKNAISAEETLNLQMAEKLELERASNDAMGNYIKALYEALGAAELLSSEVEKFGPRAFAGDATPKGVNPFDPKMPNLSPGSGSGDREKAQGEYDRVKQELEALQNPVNQIVAGAEAIGQAFGESFKGLISGAMTAQQALANFFQKTADHFLDMAAQMIAKYIEMQVIGLAMNFLGSAATGSAASGGYTFGGGGSGSSMFMPGAPSFMADGGFVTSPTQAVIGEGSQPEYVIPASKMPSAMARWSSGARGDAVVNGADPTGAGGDGAFNPVINISAGNTLNFEGRNYVSREDFQLGLAQAAKQGAELGQAKALRRLQMSASARGRLGMA